MPRAPRLWPGASDPPTCGQVAERPTGAARCRPTGAARRSLATPHGRGSPGCARPRLHRDQLEPPRRRSMDGFVKHRNHVRESHDPTLDRGRTISTILSGRAPRGDGTPFSHERPSAVSGQSHPKLN
jgi:hypothetical protein